MKKLIFFDIDGTLLTEGTHRYIPDSARQAIHKLQENGHLCFINTGRTTAEIREDIEELECDGFVCGCGTYIKYHDEILLSHEIPMPLADHVLEDMNLCHLEWVLEGSHNTYYSTEPYTTHIGDFHDDFSNTFSEATHDVPPSTRGLVYDKFCICLTKNSDFSSFYNKYQKEFTFIDRGDQFYEVVPAGYSKASGIQFLMDYFSVSKEDTIAVGDSTNDLPMLEFAGFSIGMKNSDPQILPVVDYVTDTVENDGILKAFEHLHLL